MPAIPYIQPIPKWIEEELDSRANNQARLIKTRPFVMLTSPAVISKSPKNNERIINENYDASYRGCVLSNTTDTDKLYQTGNTIIGYDLNGNPIEVVGESNRKLSVPLIIDLQIEEMGENAALKTAKLNIKIFSLKQLEMFELFFLRPGMQLVLEYGNNSDLTAKNIDIKNKMFPKKDWQSFVQEFMSIYSPLDEKWPDIKEAYLQKLKDTKGNYNVWTGKVQGYSFAVDSDGTYNVNLEIAAGNELASQLLSQSSKPEGKKSAKIIKGDYTSYVAKIAEDIDPHLIDALKDVSKWKNEFFNWGAINEKSEDNTISKKPYISVRLALKIINSLNVSSNIIWGSYKDKTGKKIDVIPVSSTKYMMSSNENIIFPGTLPDIVVNQETGQIQVLHKPVKDADPNKQTFEVLPGETSLINGYSFNIDESGNNINNFNLPTDKSNITLPKYTANLLNAFISYEKFISFKTSSIKNSDLLIEMLKMIQDSMYGYSYLELATPDSSSGPDTGLTIIDRKLLRKIPNNKPYRFKIGPTNSIIHTFSFDFQMDDLMAGQTLYATQLDITEADSKFNSKQSQNLKYPESLAATATMDYFKNADGFYSINPIEVKLQKQLVDKKRKDDEIAKKEAKPLTKKEADAKKAKEEKEEKGIITEKVKQAKETKNKSYIRFKFDGGDKKTHNLIYTDEALLKYYLVKEPEPDTVLVSGVDVTIAMDGISGLSTGDYFHIDGVPEVYNQNGYFQITAIQHGINNDGWLTTITAGWLRKQ